ncbi:MAG: glutathione peroxidase [Lysobacterales bacterium]|nr:MAG: glutathione peroxidase [Xanthomonadales bacterium]
MSNAHEYNFMRIDGKPLPLAGFEGKAVLIVNTASECGFTPQYADLQRLWEQYRDRDLVVLGVPSNDFGAQEPGGESAIAAFCTERYAVDFPMTEKVEVIGANAHPFYRWIAETVGEDAAPRWNFHKYLIDGSGDLVAMWPSKVVPLSDAVTGAIEAALE